MAKKGGKICEAVRSGDMSKLSVRLQKYDSSSLWTQDKAGNYSLHCAVSTHMCTEATRIEMIQRIINTIPENRRYDYISLKNTLASQTALHVAAMCGEAEIMCTLLDSLTPSEIHKLVKSEDYQRRTILDYDLKENIRDIILGYTQSLATNDTVNALDECAGCDNIDQTDGKQTTVKQRHYSHTEINFENCVESEQPNQNMLSMFSRNNRLRASSTSYSNIPKTLPAEVCLMNEEEDEETIIVTLTNQPAQPENRGVVKNLHLADDNTFAEIHKAVVSRSLKQVRQVLRRIESQDMKSELLSRIDSMGKTLFHHAASHCCADILHELVDNIGPNYRPLLQKRDAEQKTVEDYAQAKKVREFLRNIYTQYWEPIVRQPDIIIICNGVEDSFQTDKLRTSVREMRRRGMTVSLYIDMEENLAIELVMKCQIANTTGIVLLMIETGPPHAVWNIDNIIGVLYTTAMYFKPKVRIVN